MHHLCSTAFGSYQDVPEINIKLSPAILKVVEIANAVAQGASKSKMLCLKTVYYSRELLTEDIRVPPKGLPCWLWQQSQSTFLAT